MSALSNCLLSKPLRPTPASGLRCSISLLARRPRLGRNLSVGSSTNLMSGKPTAQRVLRFRPTRRPYARCSQNRSIDRNWSSVCCAHPVLGRILSIEVHARASINHRSCRAVCSRQLVDGDHSPRHGLSLLLEQIHSGGVLRCGKRADLIFAQIHYVLGQRKNVEATVRTHLEERA